MRNTPKLRLFNHLMENRRIISDYFENHEHIPFKELPTVNCFYSHHEEVLKYSLEVLKVNYISPEAIMYVICKHSNESDSCRLYRTSVKNLMHTKPDIYKELKDNGFQNEDNFIYILDCSNPSQSKNLDRIITHFLDEYREGITYRYRKNYRSILWAVNGFGGIDNGEGGSNRAWFREWFYVLSECMGILRRNYRCY